MFIELSFFNCIHYSMAPYNFISCSYFHFFLILYTQDIVKKTDHQYTYFVFSDKNTM